MNKIKKIVFVMIAAFMSLRNTCLATKHNFADPSPASVKSAISKIRPQMEGIFGTVMAIALYISIVIIGINLIIYRNKPEERSSVMTGFLYIAIGTLIFTSAYFICDLLVPEYMVYMQ